MRTLKLATSLAAVALLAGALIALPVLAHSPPQDSEATIAVEDCVVESSKEISFVAFFSDGEEAEKLEGVDAETFDLTLVEGIEDVESIAVKSGTTLATFAIDCPTAPAGEEAPENGETKRPEGGTTEEPDETSAATITVEDCVVESSKDISHIAFFDDGEEIERRNINSESFDLTQVEGIEDIESIEVKSSTTVEDFAIDCGSDVAAAETPQEDETEEPHEDKTEEPDDDETEDEDNDDDDDE